MRDLKKFFDRLFYLLILLPLALSGFIINTPIFVIGKFIVILTFFLFFNFVFYRSIFFRDFNFRLI